MTEIEAKVVAAWHQAAADLGIRFTSPFTVTLPDGRLVESLGFIHHFGRRVGTSISVLGEPSSKMARLKADDDYFQSMLGSGYARYVREDFIETLNDWGYFGPVASRPAWYSPASHWTGDGPMGVQT